MFTDNAINAINEAIEDLAAHDLAEALASAGVTAARSGWPNSDAEACEVAGYGTIFSRDTGWQVRDLDGDEYLIDNDELASNLAEIVAMTKAIS